MVRGHSAYMGYYWGSWETGLFSREGRELLYLALGTCLGIMCCVMWCVNVSICWGRRTRVLRV